MAISARRPWPCSRSLLFDFTNMKTGVCFPRVRTLQERLQPWYSRASIFRALDRLEAAGVLTRVSRRMRNAGKVVQGATLYVFGRITEAEQNMVQKAKALAKATARAVRPVLWPRRPSESQSARGSCGEPDFLGLKAGKSLP